MWAAKVTLNLALFLLATRNGLQRGRELREASQRHHDGLHDEDQGRQADALVVRGRRLALAVRLELRDVRKVYESGHEEVVALDHASLTVESDEIVALVGPSGSGKTTLLSIAGGLLTPTDGEVIAS